MNYPNYSVQSDFCAHNGPQFRVNYNHNECVTHTLAVCTNALAAELVVSALRAAQADRTS